MNWIIFAVIVLIILAMVKRMMPMKGVGHITADELQGKMKKDKRAHFIDVREPNEFSAGHIKGMENVPLSRFKSAASGLPKDKEIVVICQSGNRSVAASNKLKKAGFGEVTNVRGGMSAWSGQVKRGS